MCYHYDNKGLSIIMIIIIIIIIIISISPRGGAQRRRGAARGPSLSHDGSTYVCVCAYVCVYMYTCVYIYIYIYIYRERERDRKMNKHLWYVIKKRRRGAGQTRGPSLSRRNLAPECRIGAASKKGLIMCVYIYIYTHVYIYIYIQRERDREIDMIVCFYVCII